MHIWAGSGSSSNGKDTVRRRSMTPKKASKSLEKRKSSARIGLGMDGSCSNEQVEQSSPSPSPRKDSGIDSEMASEDSDHTVTTYDIEESMVKPLDAGSLDSFMESMKNIERIESVLKEQKRKMDEDHYGSLDNPSTPKMPKGEALHVVERIEHGLDDSRKNDLKIVYTIQRLEAGEKDSQRMESDEDSFDAIKDFSIPKRSKGEDSTLADSDDSNRKDSDAFSRSFIGLSRMTANGNRIFRAEKGNEERQVDSPTKDLDGDAFHTNSPLDTKRKSPKDLPQLDTTGLTQNDRQHLAFLGSEYEQEKLFSHEQVSEPEKPEELECVGIIQNNTHIVPIDGLSNTSSSESENELERIFGQSSEESSEPPEAPDEHLGDENFTPGIKPFHTTQDVSQEYRSDATIRDFSMKVPTLVREAEQSLNISPLRFCRSDAPSVLGEVSSLRETEFCGSGLKDHVVNEVGRTLALGGSEMILEGSAHMEDESPVENLEGAPSNLGSPISLPIMGNREVDPFTAVVFGVNPRSSVSMNSSAEVENDHDENSPSIQRRAISLPEYRCPQFELYLPDSENCKALPSYKENVDSAESENEYNIADSESFSPVNQRVISSMTPKQPICNAVKYRYGTPPTSYHGSIFGSPKSNYVSTFNGKEPEECLVGGEGYSESEEEMGYIPPGEFWMKDCKGKAVSFLESEVERWTETEAETDEEELQYCLEMGRRMKRKNPELLGPTIDEKGTVIMQISQAKSDNTHKSIRLSIPQLDGPDSPPFLSLDSGSIERTWSPSPRKKLQKVNRSKSSNPMQKSSSSSLRRLFQNSRVEGMEGEIRDLRTEVRELRSMVDDLEKELKCVRVREEIKCETMKETQEKVKEVWRSLYGKGWDGEKLGEKGEDWKDKEEVEWTKEVRDVGLLRVVGRIERERGEESNESDAFWKERGIIKRHEMNLILPTRKERKSKGIIQGERKGKEPIREDTNISPEYQDSKDWAIGEGLRTRDSVIWRLIKSEDSLVSDDVRSEEKLSKLKKECSDTKYERKSLEKDLEKFGDTAGERLEIEIGAEEVGGCIKGGELQLEEGEEKEDLETMKRTDTPLGWRDMRKEKVDCSLEEIAEENAEENAEGNADEIIAETEIPVGVRKDFQWTHDDTGLQASTKSSRCLAYRRLKPTVGTYLPSLSQTPLRIQSYDESSDSHVWNFEENPGDADMKLKQVFDSSGVEKMDSWIISDLPVQDAPGAISSTQTRLTIRNFSELPEFDLAGRYSSGLRMDLFQKISRDFSKVDVERMRREDRSGKGAAIFGKLFEKKSEEGGNDEQESRKLAGQSDREYKPGVELKYIDADGRNMNQKEAFKHLTSQFRSNSKGSGEHKKSMGRPPIEGRYGLVERPTPENIGSWKPSHEEIGELFEAELIPRPVHLQQKERARRKKGKIKMKRYLSSHNIDS